MTIRAYNGFESDTTILQAEGMTFSGSPTVVSTHRHQTTSGYGGSKSLCIGYLHAVTIPTPVVATSDEIQLKVFLTSSNARLHIEFNPTAATPNVTVCYDNDGYVRIRRGGGVSGTLLATSSSVLALGMWHTLKIRVTARDAGRVQVYANGNASTLVDTGASVDCKNTTTDDFTTIRIVGQHMTTENAYIDDFVHATNGSIPDEAVFCLMLRPTGDGATIESTPSTGSSRYATVDEDPVSTSDYNTLSTAGHEDQLTMADLPATPTSILAVRTVVHATGEGTITLLRGLVKSGASVGYGTNQALSTGGSYTAIKDIFETDPATASAWTASAVNAMSAGYEAN